MSVPRPLVAATATVALLLVPLAGSAAAHVTVQGQDAQRGGFTKLVFRAPTEKDVPTTRLEVAFPQEQPIASVRVKPKQGWTYRMVKAAPAEPFEAFGEPVKEVVTRIVWTSSGKGIGASEFDEFEVSAGPLPDVDRLAFPALQTYADGDVVRWIEPAVEGQEEPEHPAPVLQLAAADEGGTGTIATRAAGSSDSTTAAASSGTDRAGTVLGGAGLAAGLLGLLLGGLALARSGRSRARVDQAPSAS